MSGVGVEGASIEPRDLRFYVSELSLTPSGGASVSLDLEPDPQWQFQDLALLDFEDVTEGCRNGNADIRDRVVALVETALLGEGPFDLTFTLGVPFDLNRQNQALAPGPLSLSELFWSWNAGYKFLRAEVLSDGLPQGFFVHLGSTRHSPEGRATRPATECLDSNPAHVTLEGFAPRQHQVVFDLADLLRESSLGEATEGERGACMSAPDAPSCAGVFRALGLPIAGEEAEGQQVFRLEPVSP